MEIVDVSVDAAALGGGGKQLFEASCTDQVFIVTRGCLLISPVLSFTFEVDSE